MAMQQRVDAIAQWLQQVDDELLYTPDELQPPRRRRRSRRAVWIGLFFLGTAMTNMGVLVLVMRGDELSVSSQILKCILIGLGDIALATFCFWPHLWLGILHSWADMLTVPHTEGSASRRSYSWPLVLLAVLVLAALVAVGGEWGTPQGQALFSDDGPGESSRWQCGAHDGTELVLAHPRATSQMWICDEGTVRLAVAPEAAESCETYHAMAEQRGIPLVCTVAQQGEVPAVLGGDSPLEVR